MIDPVSHLDDATKHLLDAGAFMAVALHWVGVLSPLFSFIATVLTILWIGLRIYDWCEARWKRDG